MNEDQKREIDIHSYLLKSFNEALLGHGWLTKEQEKQVVNLLGRKIIEYVGVHYSNTPEPNTK